MALYGPLLCIAKRSGRAASPLQLVWLPSLIYIKIMLSYICRGSLESPEEFHMVKPNSGAFSPFRFPCAISYNLLQVWVK